MNIPIGHANARIALLDPKSTNSVLIEQAAKKFHGTRCQACDLDFSERYGAIGKGFIEAHHLRPIARLQEGIAVTYDIAADFAVLCSNCHRIIHRSADPSDLALFRENVTSNKT